MWWCEDKLNRKTAHFRLPFVAHINVACLSSLLFGDSCILNLHDTANLYLRSKGLKQQQPTFRESWIGLADVNVNYQRDGYIGQRVSPVNKEHYQHTSKRLQDEI